MKRALRFINKIMLYAFFVVGVILFFKGTGRISTMLSAFGAFAFSILLAWLLHLKNINEKYWLFINIALWFNVIGEIFAYYSGLFVYDKLLHLATGVLITMIIYSYYKENSTLSKDMVFVTAIGLMVLFEIYEYLWDVFFGSQLQGVVRGGVYILSSLDDTMQDIIWGTIGSLVYLFFKKENVTGAIKKGIKNIEKKGNRKKGQFRLSFKEFLKFILR